MNSKTEEGREAELAAFEKQVEANTKEFNENLKRDFPRINDEILAEIEKTLKGPTFKEHITGLLKKIIRK